MFGRDVFDQIMLHEKLVVRQDIKFVRQGAKMKVGKKELFFAVYKYIANTSLVYDLSKFMLERCQLK